MLMLINQCSCEEFGIHFHYVQPFYGRWFYYKLNVNKLKGFFNYVSIYIAMPMSYRTHLGTERICKTW